MACHGSSGELRLMAFLGSLPTFARTVRQLRLSQIAWRAVHVARMQADNRVPALGAARVRPDPNARPAALPALEIPGIGPRPAQLWQQGIVEYHGITASRHDWKGEGQSRLWRYERQYHGELVSLAASNTADARALIDDWIASNPPCRGEAWEPYPVARRLLNWSLAGAIAPSLRSHLAPWMAAQMRFLARRLERHLLGNHLLCDLCALVAAAASLECEDSASVGTRAARRLERELERQVLPDGGYAERTAQYHLIVLQDALLALVLHRARGRTLATDAVLARMLGWVERIRRRDGSFPCLNDAVPGSSPSIDTISGLAKLAGVIPPGNVAAAVTELPDTGWTLVRVGAYELLFEHGEIGPKEQPGHGHADTLSFELMWDGEPVVTDTGVTTYAPGEIRNFERSAAAHATVSVNGQGADEIWASFRVGGRGRSMYLGTSSPWPGAWLLRGQVRSYQGWTHHRSLLFWPKQVLVVCDDVLHAPARAQILSNLPLDPAWRVADLAEDGGILESATARLQLVVLAGQALSAVRGEYPRCQGWVGRGFGAGEGRVSVRLRPDERGRLVYALVAPEVRVSFAGGELRMDTDSFSQQLKFPEPLS
jgi:hypothetical protein